MQGLAAKREPKDTEYWQSLSASVLSIDFCPSLAKLVQGDHQSFAVSACSYGYPCDCGIHVIIGSWVGRTVYIIVAMLVQKY